MPALRPSDDIVDFMHHLADTAADAIKPFFRSDLTVTDKGGNRRFDPVTEGDRAVERAIRERLAEKFPTHAILGEELGVTPGSAPYRWVIDPIDGTRAFILGLPTWGTLIGLEIDDQPTFGLMSQPYTGDRFWCDSRQSYFRGSTGGERAIFTRATVALHDAQMAATHPDLFAPGFEQQAFKALSGRARACRYGTDCYGYALLAAGLVDLVVEASLQPYDIVALIPIIEQAGGVVTDWDGGPARHGGRILAAANRALHEEAIAVLERVKGIEPSS